MSNLSGFRDRKRNLSFLGGRTLAVVVITVVAAVSFSLGYKVGHSGVEGKAGTDQTQVVPEGAGLVLLGGQGACEESSPGRSDPAAASERTTPSVAVLEAMKPVSVPEPDNARGSTGPEEPVLEPIAGQKTVSAPLPGQAEHRVAPIRQLPSKQPEVSALAMDGPAEEAAPASVESAPPPVRKQVKEPVRSTAPQKPAVTAKRPEPARKADVTKKPAISSDGGTYSVQVGAFSSLSDAQTHRVRFTRKGYKASVYKDSNKSGADVFKVRIGMFTSRTEAEKMAMRLKSQEGVNGFVTAIE